MQYEVIYQLRGETYACHLALTTRDLGKAQKFCRNLSNFPAETIRYLITAEDGSVIHDTNETKGES